MMYDKNGDLVPESQVLQSQSQVIDGKNINATEPLIKASSKPNTPEQYSKGRVGKRTGTEQAGGSSSSGASPKKNMKEIRSDPFVQCYNSVVNWSPRRSPRGKSPRASPTNNMVHGYSAGVAVSVAGVSGAAAAAARVEEMGM